MARKRKAVIGRTAERNRRGADAKRQLEPGKQRRSTGDASEMPKAMRETRLRQRY